MRELQPVLSQNYISGSSIHVVMGVFSVMAAYAAMTLKTPFLLATLFTVSES